MPQPAPAVKQEQAWEPQTGACSGPSPHAQANMPELALQQPEAGLAPEAER
jgi:hypothetical protein